MIGERASANLAGSIHVYLPNVDYAYHKPLEASAVGLSEPRNLPSGDRSAGARDVQGSQWWLGAHLAAT